MEQNKNDEYINKQTNKKENSNESSVKYGNVNRPDKKWAQKKSFMISYIITLIIFVLCTGKFSPSTKSSR